VPFVDLSRIHKELKEVFLSRVGSVIDRSAFVLGPEVEQFEKAFAEYCERKFAIGVSSGLDALVVALKSLGIGPGDEVITQTNTFIATAYAISAVGATPVFADVEEENFNLSPHELEKRITSKTRAVIPVHLYGQSASMSGLSDVLKRNNISLVEDCAQSHGAKFGDRKVGSFGSFGCFSFYPGKNLGALGEGGALVTSDPNLFEKAVAIRNVGQTRKNEHRYIAGNYRLHTLQAAFLSVKLPLLDKYNSERNRVASLYKGYLEEVDRITFPAVAQDRNHVFHLYVIRVKDPSDRDRLIEYLGSKGIQTGIHYPTPIHLQPCYKELGYGAGDFPVAEKLASTIISLPMFAGMTEDEVKTVASAIKDFFTN